MKKKIMRFMAMVIIVALFSSCATIFGGAVSDCQKTKPAPGQPARELRVVALIADIVIFWPAAIVDFATNAIYKPCGK